MASSIDVELRDAIAIYNKVEDRQIREKFQMTAIFDILTRFKFELLEKQRRLLDGEFEVNRVADELGTTFDNNNSLEEDFSSWNETLQVLKEQVYVELNKLKSQMHTQRGTTWGNSHLTTKETEVI